MELLLALAEQLDRAAVELRLDHPIHNRLAIILIDNTVELMARDALFVFTAVGGDFAGITAKHRRQARSQSLNERLSVLVFVGEMSQLEADFIKAAHAHRNAAYHEGYANEPYLRQLAFLYFQFACTYLARFSRAFYSWSSAFKFTDIGRRYYDASRAKDELMGKIDRDRLAGLLLAELPHPPSIRIQPALADDLEDDRQQIAAGLRFLIDNVRPKRPTAYLLAKAQFDWSRDTALRKRGLEDTIFDTPRRTEAAEYAKANRAKFLPKYKAIPHGSWSQAIGRIRACPDPMLAVVMFHRTRRKMEYLGEAIEYAVVRLEGELERS